MSNNVTADSLLLVTDFNSFCSKKLVSEIRQWFEEQFIVVNSSDRTRFYPGMPEDDGRAIPEQKRYEHQTTSIRPDPCS